MFYINLITSNMISWLLDFLFEIKPYITLGPEDEYLKSKSIKSKYFSPLDLMKSEQTMFSPENSE